jgi:hypothetical protein
VLFAATSHSHPVGITGEDYFGRFLSTVPGYMNDLVDKGTVVADWVLVGRNGSLSIWDVESEEELQKHLKTNHPIGAHITWEVFAIVPLPPGEGGGPAE